MKKKIITVVIMFAAICGMGFTYTIFRNKEVAQGVTVIGGHDGPTSIFIAGKIGSFMPYISTVLAGAIVAAIVAVLLLWRKKK